MVCMHQKLPDPRWFAVIVQLFVKRGASCSLLLCQMFRFSEVQAPCCPSNFAAWILFFSSTHMIFILWQDGEGGVWFWEKKNMSATFLSLQHFYVCHYILQYRGYFFFYMCLSIFYCQLEWWIVVLWLTCYPFINWAFRWPILWWQRSNGWEVAEHSWGWDTICWRPYLHRCKPIKSSFTLEDSINLQRTRRWGLPAYLFSLIRTKWQCVHHLALAF